MNNFKKEIIEKINEENDKTIKEKNEEFQKLIENENKKIKNDEKIIKQN